ncbi:tRNA pseudouridine(38-40) synthase TruA [Clostridium luticellarii]|jgi:tRNA pseudouridine38-40 synthase|uniref:tRNA pseudouridine synthase A n=1 Tax=Clostridium luticellarii TaxID=1691940 RepID=A0A2T0BSF3_9CLOT|nr:tRNA pseudouridine(38-40) synthase TruA [Clostridium luticellarii]MCI1944719.1 tRNA pseudouridine(38-40) synthase TruA [Clostridium luticellarii]MCI1968216.1 tRNA pseudouridine(38-40) synthase TruA [Clostridium luticellarii]MCI1995239.1 tRNA pseudouridine(38-40) synthase TruA [Clostridium luticellarii]MCI2039764.1 tRNA pseudouridine(38-40) synthase TruA [Clostridium luticellarii]PRR86745.1 tRNA pseudouridine synthase A [Clostridium luticellarii]
MKNIKLTIQYDGTNYSGWQRQKNAVTVQEKLENAIRETTGSFSATIGSSRTDAGVHAKEFVCNFFTDSKIPAPNFKMVLNGVLPEDIVVLKSERVDDSFHARFQSIGKKYIYTIITGNNRPVIGRQYVYYFRRKLDVEKIKMACKYFLGIHDFSAFKKKGGSVRSSVRTISEMEVTVEGKLIKFSVIGDGFLYNMVRIMVGTLLEVGVGRFQPEDIKYILESKDRTKAGKPVPALGLCLEKVFY